MSAHEVVVVGAGVAGLAAARALVRTAPDLDVVVLDRRERAGGLVGTERTPEGFVIEDAADCIVTSKPWGMAAVRELGLRGDVVRGPEPRRSFVVRDGRLHVLPPIFGGMSPEAVVSMLGTPLLSLTGKARLALEPFMPRGPAEDESVADFVRRRFGDQMLQSVIEPLLSGVFGGKAELLSIDTCMPKLRELERKHRSVVLGVQKAIRARRERERAGEDVLPMMVSLRDGMGSLPEAFAKELGDRVRLGVRVERIERGAGGGFRVVTGDGGITCDGVVMAVPAWAAPGLIEGLDADLAAGLGAIRYNALDCVSYAWPREQVPHPMHGTGFVTASDETRPTTACTWSSNKWPGRAPEGRVLLRSVLNRPEASDEELVTMARADLRELMGIEADPMFTRVRRYPRATPLYEVGHLGRVARLRERAAALGAFALAGNALTGVGIPDCIHTGQLAASAVLEALGERPEERPEPHPDTLRG